MWEQHDWPALEAAVRGAGPERLRHDYRWWSGEADIEDMDPRGLAYERAERPRERAGGVLTAEC